MKNLVSLMLALSPSLGKASEGPSNSNKHGQWPVLVEKLIQPDHPRDDFVMKLSGYDQLCADSYISLVLAFPTLLDAETIMKALGAVQDTLPEFGARYVIDKKFIGPASHFIGAKGIQFEYQSINDPEQKGVLRHLRMPGLENSPELRPSDWKALRAVREMVSGPSQTSPLVYLRLSRFEAQGVSLIGLCINHALGDAASHSLFLKALSYHAGKIAGKENILPKVLPCFPLDASKPLEQAANGHDRYRQDSFPGIQAEDRNQLWSSLGAIAHVPRFVYRLATYESMDFIVASEGLDRLKRQVITELKKEDSTYWVSSYEILMACAVEGILSAQGPRQNPLEFSFAINLRERTEGFRSAYYIGNGVNLFPFSCDRSCQRPSVNQTKEQWLVKAAWDHHLRLRSIINSSSEQVKCGFLQHFEELQARGGKRLSLFNSLIPHVAGIHNPLMLNNWTGYSWFDVDFGSGVRSTTFGVPMDFPPGMVQLNPRHSSHRTDDQAGDLTLSISLPKWQAESFKAFVVEHDLPFTLVQ